MLDQQLSCCWTPGGENMSGYGGIGPGQDTVTHDTGPDDDITGGQGHMSL